MLTGLLCHLARGASCRFTADPQPDVEEEQLQDHEIKASLAQVRQPAHIVKATDSVLLWRLISKIMRYMAGMGRFIALER